MQEQKKPDCYFLLKYEQHNYRHMKLNCIAIDDEPLALEKMQQYINKVDYLNLLQTFDTGIDALNFLKNNAVDLMFLDIQMEDLTGIQMLEAIDIKPKVIITTAYDKYAIKGFELDVSDYLLKPISLQRFIKATDKIYNTLNVQNDNSVKYKDSNLAKKNDFVFIKTEYRIERIDFKDILYIEGMKDYLKIFTEEKKIVTLQNFNTLLKHLPSDNFIRVHKSYVISFNKIEKIERKKIFIKDIKIPIGETYHEYFFNLLKRRDLIMY